MLAKTLQ